jgi:hypothetical protein
MGLTEITLPCFALQLYPCSRLGEILHGACITTEEAALVLEEGMAKWPLLLAPGTIFSAGVGLLPIPDVATSGLTQQVLNRACKLAADTGEQETNMLVPDMLLPSLL